MGGREGGRREGGGGRRQGNVLRVSRYGSGVAPTPPSLPLPLPLPLFLLVFRPSGFSLRLLCSFDTVIDVRALKLHPRQLHSSRLSSKLCRGRDSTTKKKKKKKEDFTFPSIGSKIALRYSRRATSLGRQFFYHHVKLAEERERRRQNANRVQIERPKGEELHFNVAVL